ncbi:response regulator [Thermodesulfobacteriota bacterium]
MKEIVNWLLEMEQKAGTFYSLAIDSHQDDSSLSAFLKHMAEDEAWHYHIMGSAAQYLRSSDWPPEDFTIDDTTRTRIEAPLNHSLNKLAVQTLDIDSLLECILVTEFSEWNDIFLYVVTKLTAIRPEFQYTAQKIQQHISYIEHFFTSTPEYSRFLDTIKTFPKVWHEKILIVDDDPAVAGLLKAIMKNHGEIDIARNGQEGLQMIDNHEYGLIISNIDMPGLNGIEFFQQATRNHQHLRKRFLYFTGAIPEATLEFLTRNNLSYLMKPASIARIREKALEILQLARAENNSEHLSE